MEPTLLQHQSRGYLKPKVVVLDLRNGQKWKRPALTPNRPTGSSTGRPRANPPATGGSGENVGEPPTKEIIERIKSLPKA